jgi:hypothetical protein
LRSIVSHPDNSYMFYRYLVCMLFLGVIVANETSELKKKDPKIAFLFSLVPGMGQAYNGKWIKSAMVIGLEVSSFIYWQDNISKYNDYEQNNYPLSRHRYLEKRNKYAWWIGIIYVYAMIDAVVDAHLHSFNDLMESSIRQQDNKEIKHAE